MTCMNARDGDVQPRLPLDLLSSDDTSELLIAIPRFNIESLPARTCDLA